MITLLKRRVVCDMFVMLAAIFVVSWVLVVVGQRTAFGKDELQVVRDKEKTTYVIGSDDDDYKREQERDKDRAWEMLRNQNLLIDGRGGRQKPGAGK